MGLLSKAVKGLGDGLIAKANIDFQALQQEAREEAALELERISNEYARQESETEFNREKGLLTRVMNDETGRVQGVTKGGEVKDLGFSVATGVAGSAASGGGSASAGGADAPDGPENTGIEMTAGEKRTYEELKGRYTDPNTDQVDYDKLVQHLRSVPLERGGERWNQIADQLTGSIGTNMPASEARAQARREADNRKSLFKPRSSEFSETGGDEKAWIDMRTRELVGGGQGSANRGNRQANAGKPASGGGAPPGQGTQASPFKGTSQAHIEWFKNSAPKGAVIEVEGKLYTK
ncbi:MAG: hypothetical protein RJQ08_13630 [Salinisphaeraceae bacterium]